MLVGVGLSPRGRAAEPVGVPAGLKLGAEGANIVDHLDELLEGPGAKEPVVNRRITRRLPKDRVEGNAREVRTDREAVGSRDPAVPSTVPRSAGRSTSWPPRGLADVTLGPLPISSRAKGHGLVEAPWEDGADVRVGVGDAPNFGEVGEVEVGAV